MGFTHEIDEATFRELLDGVRREITTYEVCRVDETRVEDWPYWVYRSLDNEWITATGAGSMRPPFIEWLEDMRVRAELAHPDDLVCSVGRSVDGQWYGWVSGLTKPCEDREACCAYVREMVAKFSEQTGPAFGLSGVAPAVSA